MTAKRDIDLLDLEAERREERRLIESHEEAIRTCEKRIATLTALIVRLKQKKARDRVRGDNCILDGNAPME